MLMVALALLVLAAVSAIRCGRRRRRSLVVVAGVSRDDVGCDGRRLINVACVQERNHALPRLPRVAVQPGPSALAKRARIGLFASEQRREQEPQQPLKVLDPDALLGRVFATRRTRLGVAVEWARPLGGALA
jgi:hypothetical protein